MDNVFGISIEEMQTAIEAVKKYCKDKPEYTNMAIMSVDADSSILRGFKKNRRINIDLLVEHQLVRLFCVDGRVMDWQEYTKFRKEDA